MLRSHPRWQRADRRVIHVGDGMDYRTMTPPYVGRFDYLRRERGRERRENVKKEIQKENQKIPKKDKMFIRLRRRWRVKLCLSPSPGQRRRMSGDCVMLHLMEMLRLWDSSSSRAFYQTYLGYGDSERKVEEFVWRENEGREGEGGRSRDIVVVYILISYFVITHLSVWSALLYQSWYLDVVKKCGEIVWECVENFNIKEGGREGERKNVKYKS